MAGRRHFCRPLSSSKLSIIQNHPAGEAFYHFDASQCLVAGSERALDSKKRLLDLSERCLDRSQRPLDASNCPLDASNRHLDVSNCHLDRSE